MKAVCYSVCISFLMLCGCWRDKPINYSSLGLFTSLPADTIWPPVHTVIDTMVAGRTFRISGGVEHSSYCLFVEFNGGRDSFSGPINMDTFSDDGMLFYQDTIAFYKGFKFLNDSMVVIEFPTFVYNHWDWVLYQAQGTGMRRVSGGVTAGPYPVYIDLPRHRIISVGAMQSDTSLTNFYRERTIYDYLHDKRRVEALPDSMFPDDLDLQKFYMKVK